MCKRFFDIIVSVLLCPICLPLILTVAAIVRLALGSPVFFCQLRPGKNAVPFYIYKFRTMRDSTDELGYLLSDEQRMTRLGSFLRSSSLDELPELFNVLLGDMSIVGPRPLLMEYVSLYSKEQARRHNIRPGITGWAQVNGRNSISWDERLKLDVWYVDNQTFWLDMKILWLTLYKVIKREGISQGDHVTMRKFTGPDKTDAS